MKRINLFAILFALCVAVNANAQSGPAADFTVTPTSVGGAQVSGDVPNNANLTINLGSAPAPSAPAVSETPVANPTTAPAAESCTAGLWCTLVKVGSWIGAIGAVLLETIIVLGLLALVAGAIYYFLFRRYERRQNHTWHRRNALLGGRYREALVAGGALDDGDPNRVVWARRAERRYAQLLGHNERDGQPTAAADLPVPPPLTAADEDADA